MVNQRKAKVKFQSIFRFVATFYLICKRKEQFVLIQNGVGQSANKLYILLKKKQQETMCYCREVFRRVLM